MTGYEQDPNTGHKPASKAQLRIAAAFGVALVLGLAVLIGVKVKQANAKAAALAQERESVVAAALKKDPVAVVSPRVTTWKPRVEITGTLQPWRSADISFEQPGRLTRVLVATGDIVKEGQLLAYLDASMASAQVGQAAAQTAAAEANLALAQDNLTRTEGLVASKSVTEAQAVAARSQVALAKAQLEGARASERLAHTGAGQRSIAAPFPGLVTKAPTAAGGVVAVGAPLVHLEDHSRFRLSATIGEELADLVKPGLAVVVKYRDRQVNGKVSTVVPSLDQATRRLPMEVEVENDPKEPLLAWSFVHATIDSGREVPALRLPATARRPGAENQIVVVKDGKVVILHVTATIDTDGTLVVRDGLAPTDVVVAVPTSDLHDGEAIVTKPSGT
ncbi:efflux RND transporter periplasmic adaptor subunit [soil metagenome]